MERKKTAKKVVGIILNILLYAFFALCLCALIFSIVAGRDSTGAVSLFGKQMRLVLTESMESCDETDVSEFRIKSIPKGSLVFIDLVPADAEKAKAWYGDLEVGDVLTFQYGTYGTSTPITHRIISITENDGGYTILLAGDNKADSDGVLTQTIRTAQAGMGLDYVIGKVTGQSRALGWIFTILKQPVGLALVIIVPCALIIVMQIVRIVGVLGADKKKKAAEEKEKQADEIEELKRQLSELQAAQTSPTEAREDSPNSDREEHNDGNE